jgi:hypothetical protein
MVTHPNAPVTARRRAYRPRQPAEMARELIEDIDLRQAARHTGEPTAP